MKKKTKIKVKKSEKEKQKLLQELKKKISAPEEFYEELKNGK